MLHPEEGTLSIFDVGGDDVGARALAAFRPSIDDYELWQVVNSKAAVHQRRRGLPAHATGGRAGVAAQGDRLDR